MDKIVGYRKINETEYQALKKGIYLSPLSDYINANVYRIKNNSDYMFFFSNVLLCKKFIKDSLSKSYYYMRCSLPASSLEYGHGYYNSLKIPEFRIRRSEFKTSFIDAIYEEAKLPEEWIESSEYEKIIYRSQTEFRDFPFKEERTWIRNMGIYDLGMLLDHEYTLKPYGRSSEDYLARGFLNYGITPVKNLFDYNQSENLKIDILRSVSDLVAWYGLGNFVDTEYPIYDSEGYEFAKMLIECEKDEKTYKRIKELKSTGLSNEEINNKL